VYLLQDPQADLKTVVADLLSGRSRRALRVVATAFHGTRELIEHPFIIVYQVDDVHDEIVTVAAMHGAHDRLMMEQEWNDGITPLST
jgi:plasmid stabilization system protein ParE